MIINLALNDFIKLRSLKLSVTDLYILECLVNKVELNKCKLWGEISGRLNVLEKKGFIDCRNELTKEGTALILHLHPLPQILLDEQKKENNYFDRLHVSLQTTLHSLINKKQIKGFGGVYFIPTRVELEEFLKRFIKKYKNLYDEEKIEKVLTRHIIECVASGNYAPAIKYFIYKDGTGSRLAPALENWEEKEEKVSNKLVNTKDLF